MKLTGKIALGKLQDFGAEALSAGHHKIPRLWMVVADERLAKIFKRDGRHLDLLGEAFRSDTHSDLNNDTVGRTVSSGSGSIHHKYEPHMGESHEGDIRFSQQLAGWLEKAAMADIFDRLVLVAAPHMLGDLRKYLGKHVKERIVAEVNKELTRHPEEDLRRELDRVTV